MKVLLELVYEGTGSGQKSGGVRVACQMVTDFVQ
jgi:hypothetical protein